ncbi:MAG: hypothetical protein WC802_04885 [Patescibacteria group bacterium]|jgi:hypothetical protein
MKKGTSQQGLIIGLAVVIAVLAITLVYSANKNAVGQKTISNGTAVNAQSFAVENWTFDSAEQKKIEKNIASLGAGQTIQSQFVIDPTDSNTVYFSTSTSLPAGEPMKTSLASVYKYNLKTQQFERLYKKEFAPGSFPGLTKANGVEDQGVSHFVLPVVRVIGYDNGRLAMLVQDTDDSPGPCSTYLSIASLGSAFPRAVVSMNIAKPYDGFTPYTLPVAVKAQSDKDLQTCMNETFPQ